ncbi:LysR substrate-binding domain-containing protein [Chitinimonas sp.]|uniref:LysR family transcriptional regulator n=1 Tax=Chitinimonas sp. TaxID=1934313 RepID=UPI0035B4D945
MKSHDRHAEILAFVTVAKLGSFAAAATALGLTASATSRKLQALEARLNTRLLHRTTRQLSLTEAGAQYLARCERWLGDLRDADAELADLQSAVRGCLRVSVPLNVGRLMVVPNLPDFLARYPALDVDLDFSDQYVDLLGGRIDVAVRIGQLSDSRLVARKLADNRRLLVAAPHYLAAHGTPAHPAELSQHSCLHYAYYQDGDIWRLHRGQETVEVSVAGRIRANNGEALYESALAGFGILKTAQWTLAPALRDGRLLPVLDDWHFAPSAVWAVYPSNRYLSPKVRAFIDFFAGRYAA